MRRTGAREWRRAGIAPMLTGMQDLTPEQQREADRRTNRQVLQALAISGVVITLGIVALFTGVAEAAVGLLDQLDQRLTELSESAQ